MELITQLENSIGVFTIYALMIGLSVMSFTFFVNTIRSITMILLGLSMVYYFFIATPAVKTEMDTYMKNLSASITGSNIAEIQNKVKELIKY